MKILPALLLSASTITCFAQQSIDLSGEWQFQIDRDGTCSPSSTFDDTIQLPGSMITRGKGDVISVNTQWTGSLYDSSFYFNPYMEKYRVEGQMKFPFFLTPDRHYTGNAWYRRTIDVPKSWKGKRVILTLERPHIETTLYINGEIVASENGLSAPHVFDVSKYLNLRGQNSVAIRVYNGIENVCVGQDSHSVTDQTQGNWNGIVGKMTLEAHPWNGISHVDVYPDVEQQQVRIVVKRYGEDEGKKKAKASETLRFLIDGTERKSIRESDNIYIIRLGEDMRLWDEYHPNLYTLEVCDKENDRYTTTFGMRSIVTKGMDILLNGKPVYVRGTVGNCCFPETGYPPTDEASWERIISKCKEYGLNTMRFHSYCPPEAAFNVADRLGFYLQPEGPSWPNHGVKLKRGMAIDQYLMDETKRMVEAYGNHPSFVMMCAGNEPAGDWVAWGNEWVDYWKNADPRRIYCSFNVGGGWAWDNGSQYHVKGGARGLDWDKHAPHSDDDYSKDILFPRNYKDKEPNNSPFISHEQGQWCAFPDLKERSQYTGAYKAKNFDIFEDLLRDNGMASQAEKFLHASGKLQTLAYKYEMERNLRTKDYAGFVLLGLNDYSGQGTALVGPLNVHWNEKGYVDAKQWTEFCSEVVPLAKFPKFVYSNSDTLSVPVELYNASENTLIGAVTTYSITCGDSIYAHGILTSGRTDIERGKNYPLGNVTAALGNIDSARKMTLTVSLRTATQSYNNHWDFWVYGDEVLAQASVSSSRAMMSECREVKDLKKPKPQDLKTSKPQDLKTSKPQDLKTSKPQDLKTSKPQDLKTLEPQNLKTLICDSLDERAVATLKAGGKVLLTAAGKVKYGNDIKQTYLPVFWNTSWFKMRPPHTTGAYIDKDHPVYRDFPTDDWTNLNWWELVNRAQVMNLSEFPSDYQPPMQPIDTWHVSRKCGMIIEANVLGGRLLMTTVDISSNLDKRLVARQLRYSILNYMASDEFRPTLTLEENTIRHLYENEAKPVNMFTKDSPDELKPAIK